MKTNERKRSTRFITMMKDFVHTLMGHDIKVVLRTGYLMVKVKLYILMVQFTTVNGKQAIHMDKVA